MRLIHRSSILISLVAAAISAMTARADDWPQWRGPLRDGVWRETGIIERIPESGLAVRWRASVERGYSGPVVAQGRVFVTDRVLDPERERVLCFDEATGKALWQHSHPCDYSSIEYPNGPRASPTVHEGRVFALGAQGLLVCLDAATGKLVWQKDFAKDFNGVVPRYGASAAPLVVGDLLVVCAGGQPDSCVVALDLVTGAPRWHALADRPAYSAPVLIKAGGCEQLIVWTGDSVASFDAPTGRLHWQVERKATFDTAEAVASPVLFHDRLLCLAAWNRGSMMLRLDPQKPAASVLWRTSVKPTTMLSTPVFQDDGHFFATLGNGHLACLNSADGAEIWSTRDPVKGRLGTAHLTPNGDRVFLFNQTGHLILARLTRAGLTELGRALLVEPTAGFRPQGPLTWAHPAYANKCVFARNDHELVCASLAADGTATSLSATTEIRSRVPPGFPEGNVALAFSPDSKALAAGSGEHQSRVTIIDLASGKNLPSPAQMREFISAIASSPDGRWLASAGGTEFKRPGNDNRSVGQLKLFDLGTSKDGNDLPGHTNNITAACFSPDSRTLATASADHTARLWDIGTKQSRAVLQGHAGAVLAIAFSPDGKLIATAGADRIVKLWDADTANELATLKGHGGDVRAVAFSPEGKTLATAGADKTVRLWDVATRESRATLTGHAGSVLCLAYSPDGKTLATGSGDETVKLWDAATAEERATLRGHHSSVVAVVFSPDGQKLGSSGMNDVIRLWEIGL